MSSKEESFGPVAPHYDALMSHVPYDMWVGYYQLLLTHLGATPETLLDVCCGTGTVAELLAKEDYEVTGFDLAEPMVIEARKKAKKKGLGIRYFVQDAAELDLKRKFDGAYSFFDSLNYITEPNRLQAAIKRIAAHLEPGGTFVFDVNTEYAFEQQMFDQSEHSSRSEIHYDWVGNYDPSTKIIKVEMSFKRGNLRFYETHVQRAYTQDELAGWLDEAGFEEIHVFDSYTLNPPRKRSDRLHFAAVLG